MIQNEHTMVIKHCICSWTNTRIPIGIERLFLLFDITSGVYLFVQDCVAIPNVKSKKY